MLVRRYSVTLVVILVVALLLLALRLALPSLVKDYLNGRMAQMGDYRGHAADVSIALWRGAYSLHDLEVVKVDEAVPVPFFHAESIALSVSWSALWRGAVVANVDFFNPELHFVDGDKGSQAGAGTDWRQALQQLVPISIDRLGIHSGKLHFHNFTSEPQVHLVMTDVQGSFANISNADRREGAHHAEFSLRGLMLENAATTVDGFLDPLGNFHNFDINMKVTGIDLRRINDLAEAYGNFDFESGEGTFVMELRARDGQLQGYAKPLLDKVAVFDLKKDIKKGVFSAAWEALVGGLGRVFRNQPENRIASRIEIQGNLERRDISAWQAFLSILHNAFVEAYEDRFEGDGSRARE